MPQLADTRQRLMLPSSNAWGIPDLDLDYCAEFQPDRKVLLYRQFRSSRVETVGTVLLFFVDDYRFECLWSYPQRSVDMLVRCGFYAACEPDFSLWSNHPIAEQLHNVYRTRWCGAFWQRHGVPVIPSLNWSTPESYAWAWAGIPRGVPCAAIETRSCGASRDEFCDGLLAAVSAVSPQSLLVYGERIDWLPSLTGVTLHHVRPATNERFARLRREKKIRKAV